MKVLIVARTRQGGGACIGGIAEDGRSVRLVPAAPEETWGLAFQVGDVWEIEGAPPDRVVPPHVENIAVRSRRRLKTGCNPVPTILKQMPPHTGGPEALFEGLTQVRPSGALYIAGQSGTPSRSTMFWLPDRPLYRDTTGKRIRYVYRSDDGPRSLVFVGFQEPVEEIPAGTLLRVSLAHWWRPPGQPDAELRCYVQLSGWFALSEAVRAGESAPVNSLNDRPAEPADAREALGRVFGYHAFRPLQEEIIGRALSGKDSLAVMPTGAGKSLCFQLPALLLPGLTVVVSPLISLMEDQIAQLRAAGVAAVTLNSAIPYAEYVAAAERLRAGRAKLLYVAPETLLRPETLALLQDRGVSLFTIDEAHCISEWGHDFRPEYRRLKEVRARCPAAACLALTATATERVREDIRCQLDIPPEGLFVAGFDRPNLCLAARRRTNDLREVLNFLEARKGESGIIYCATREQVDTLVSALTARGVSALAYHAGMDDSARRQNQRTFQHDQAEVIVATIAFGMGINKSNVRFILHCALPDSLETYYQQVGRAGRDGLRSDCLLLYSRGDMRTALHFIEQGSEAVRRGRETRLQAMMRFAEATSCRRRILLPYFGDAAPSAPCGACDNCAADQSGRKRVDVSEDARLFLECAKLTGQKFGIGHLVSVLRGSASERVLRWRHDRLAVYGRGRHYPTEMWKLLADRFIEQQLVDVDMEHGALKLTPRGLETLAGAAVEVHLEEGSLNPAAGDQTEYDRELFEILRGLRREIADSEGVPPYVIFSDRSLVEMANFFPQSQAAFRSITGVGEYRAARYGERFLAAVIAYAGERGIAESAPLAPVRVRKSDSDRRCVQVGEAFRAGATISELQETWNVTRATIVGHLQEYVWNGGVADPQRILSESALAQETRDRALALLQEMGCQRLGPVFEAMGGEVTYDDLRLLRIYLSSQRNRD